MNGIGGVLLSSIRVVRILLEEPFMVAVTDRRFSIFEYALIPFYNSDLSDFSIATIHIELIGFIIQQHKHLNSNFLKLVPP